MMSPRQREIKRIRTVRAFFLGAVFLGFYAPLLYLWVWELEPTMFSLGFSGLICCGVTLILLLPWRNTTDNLDRLRKYDTLFGPFFEAMITDMEANDAEKGDSWLTMDLDELRSLQNRKIHQMQRKTPYVDNLSEQPKLANYCAMIYLWERYAEEERAT